MHAFDLDQILTRTPEDVDAIYMQAVALRYSGACEQTLEKLSAPTSLSFSTVQQQSKADSVEYRQTLIKNAKSQKISSDTSAKITHRRFPPSV